MSKLFEELGFLRELSDTLAFSELWKQMGGEEKEDSKVEIQVAKFHMCGIEGFNQAAKDEIEQKKITKLHKKYVQLSKNRVEFLLDRKAQVYQERLLESVKFEPKLAHVNEKSAKMIEGKERGKIDDYLIR